MARETVSRIVVDRAAEGDSLTRMVLVSLAGHVALVAAMWLVPAEWSTRAEEAPATVMTISLSGAPGPRAGGMTPMGGRPIQRAAPLPAPTRPRPIRAPARAEPEMTVPEPEAPAAPPAAPVETAPEEARGTTPTEGETPQPGSAVAETGGSGMGFGLSTGGGGGTGGYLDVGDFCCPQYLSTMLDLVRRNWNANQQVPGETMVKFTIQRDGAITAVEVERSSGYVALDLSAQRALVLTRQLPPLPSGFTESSLTVHLNFQYQR